MTVSPAPTDALARIEDMARLEAVAREDLALLSYPAKEWVKPAPERDGQHVYDVLIVGAGQTGLAISHSLIRQGVTNILVLDKNPEGYEGVWDDFARMETLRTPKALCGIELGTASLSVQRWYIAKHGQEAWDAIQRIPRLEWMDYLRWFRRLLDLPVRNDVQVSDVRDGSDGIVLVDCMEGEKRETLAARYVVLATGFDGAGRWAVPEVITDNLPPERYSHSNGPIDFAALKDKRIGVLGHGASAFDASAAALEASAASVDLCFRRKRLPVVNPHRHLETAGSLAFFPELSDATRWAIAKHFKTVDQPPAHSGFYAATKFADFHIHTDAAWEAISLDGDGAIRVTTPHETFTFDHLIPATGYVVDFTARPELTSLAPHVLLWKERFTPPAGEEHSMLGEFPYLGVDYQFLVKTPGEAPWLGRVFAFNFSGAVSMGPHSTSISGHKYALPRLVRGLTQRLFLDQEESVMPDLVAYDEIDLNIPAALQGRAAE